ncbi:DUF2680 domain-containing protein [Schinkia sp. CFF1]
MKKTLAAFILGIPLLFSSSTLPLAENITDDKEAGGYIQDSEMDCTKNIKLTRAQMRRLDQIYHRIYRDYVDLIETYAWAGALTTEQKITRYKMLRNYIETFKKRKYQWCSEHEADEWEEEWYNNDNEKEGTDD